MNKKRFVIAIDGPAASGKSTIAQIIAKRLNCLYVDSGAMYRALTLKALNQKIDLTDKKSLVQLAQETEISLNDDKENLLRVYLDKKDVTKKIRDPQVTNNVAYLANIPALRTIMVKKQRDLSKQGPIIMEGRDITTVVFPEADRKFYLDASFNERLKRRYKQYIQEGRKINISKLENDMRLRDKRDRERKVGALKIAKDAIYIDTTKLSISEVVEKIISYIK